MTIREAGKGVVVEDSEPHDYRVGFNDGDETELTVNSAKDLEELWKSLCPEFGCSSNSVDYMERV